MHKATPAERKASLAALTAALKGAGPGVKQAVHDTQQLIAQPLAAKPAAKAAAKEAAKPAKRTYVRKGATPATKLTAPSEKPATGFAEMVDKMIALQAPIAPSGIKSVVIDHYADILRAYRAGVSLVLIAPALATASGVDVKHGTLRNYFMSMAKERGDITRTTRATRTK